jgi:hypothetical protein
MRQFEPLIFRESGSREEEDMWDEDGTSVIYNWVGGGQGAGRVSASEISARLIGGSPFNQCVSLKDELNTENRRILMDAHCIA